MPKKKSPKKNYATHAKMVGIWMPIILHEAVKRAAHKEGVSISWFVCDALKPLVGITDEDITQARGYTIPRKIEDRVGQWTPRKKEK